MKNYNEDSINNGIKEIINLLYFKNFVLSNAINESKNEDISTQNSIRVINKVIRIKMNELLTYFEYEALNSVPTCDELMDIADLLGQYSDESNDKIS